MKKIVTSILALIMSFSLFAGCASGNTADNPSGGDKETVVDGGTDNEEEGNDPEPTPEPEPEPEPDWLDTASDAVKTNLSADGYVKGNITDFTQYVGTNAYRVVTTADELVQAVEDAVWHYKSEWNGEGQPITQGPDDGYTEENFMGTVHVIEVADDINLGFYKLSEQAKSSSVIESSISNKTVKDGDGNTVPAYTTSSMVEENGISTLKIQHTNNLLIYSKNGAKITHPR